MKNYRPRIYYTEADKTLMWNRWQKGESLNAIARFFDRHHSSDQRILSETGGIHPAPRHRSRLAPTMAEREEISRSAWPHLSLTIKILASNCATNCPLGSKN